MRQPQTLKQTAMPFAQAGAAGQLDDQRMKLHIQIKGLGPDSLGNCGAKSPMDKREPVGVWCSARAGDRGPFNELAGRIDLTDITGAYTRNACTLERGVVGQTIGCKHSQGLANHVSRYLKFAAEIFFAKRHACRERSVEHALANQECDALGDGGAKARITMEETTSESPSLLLAVEN